jgi:hypothetical protein
LLLVERLMPALPGVDNDHKSHALSDLNMLRGPGGLGRTKDEYRDQRGVPMVEMLRSYISYGIRRLLKSPGFSCVAIVILGPASEQTPPFSAS